MEKLIEGGSLPGLLSAICVMLGLQVVVALGKFLWGLHTAKNAVTETGIEKLTAAVQGLEYRFKALEHTLSDMRKLKLDTRRSYSALRLLSGDRWCEIRKTIMEITEDTPL